MTLVADKIKVAYERKYRSSQLVGYEVHGRIVKEGWSFYKIEALAEEYWWPTTKAIHKSDHTDLPVDFTKPEQHKIKKDNIKTLEVTLRENSENTKCTGVIPRGESKVTVPAKNLEYTNY